MLPSDDSGRWGKGGLFTALEVRSDEPRRQYELAGKMKGKREIKLIFFAITAEVESEM